MVCSKCGYANTSETSLCAKCNYPLGEFSSNAAVPSNPAAPSPPGVSSNQAAASTPATHTSAPVTHPPHAYAGAPGRPAGQYAPYGYQPPYQYPYQYYQPVLHKPKQSFTITDAYIIIGFVLAIIGVFTYSFLLLPASIVFSMVGFLKRTNTRALGLSIASIVVGVVAIIIRIGMLLHAIGFIPDWLSSGIFN